MKMSDIRILIVEDEKVQREGYIEMIELYNDSTDPIMKFCLPADEQDNISDALKQIKVRDYDAVIVDLKLHKKGDGNKIIEEINKTKRVPIFVVTGTPSDLEKKLKVTAVYKRTDNFNEVIKDIALTTKTGLSNIMGGRGKIEDALQQVYWNNLIGRLEPWKSHVKKGILTENHLLRYILNHLIEILDNNEENYVPEEMFICPPVSSSLRTGSIVNNKNNGNLYIVISPACDLSLHDGSMKSDCIQLCMIEDNIFTQAQALIDIKVTTDTSIEVRKKRDNAKNLIKKSPSNNHTNYYHFLPRNQHFGESLINFRKVLSIPVEDIESQIDKPFLQISPAFVKDIVSRFSSYYARQGQPVLNLDT